MEKAKSSEDFTSKTSTTGESTSYRTEIVEIREDPSNPFSQPKDNIEKLDLNQIDIQKEKVETVINVEENGIDLKDVKIDPQKKEKEKKKKHHELRNEEIEEMKLVTLFTEGVIKRIYSEFLVGCEEEVVKRKVKNVVMKKLNEEEISSMKKEEIEKEEMEEEKEEDGNNQEEEEKREDDGNEEEEKEDGKVGKEKKEKPKSKKSEKEEKKKLEVEERMLEKMQIEEIEVEDVFRYISKANILKLPFLVNNPLRERIVEVLNFQEEKNSFRELVTGLSVFSKSFPNEDKLKFSFALYDFDKDDFISRQDLEKFLNLVFQGMLRRREIEGSVITELIDYLFLEFTDRRSTTGLIGYNNFKKNVMNDDLGVIRIQIDF